MCYEMSTLFNTLHLPYSLAREYTPVSSLYRVLSSPFTCSRCGWVKTICEAISSLLGHGTRETRRKVETRKFSLATKKKKKKKKTDQKKKKKVFKTNQKNKEQKKKKKKKRIDEINKKKEEINRRKFLLLIFLVRVWKREPWT